MGDQCPLCKGRKERMVIIKSPRYKMTKLASIPCWCLLSELVSSEFDLLKAIPTSYLKPEDVDSRLMFLPDDLRGTSNLIIQGSFDTFLLHIKSLFMQYRFHDPRPLFLLSRSIGILQKFYVKQADGTCLNLSETSKYGLVVIVFGVREKNQQLASCMLQVIQNRIQEKRPTWIFLPDSRASLAECEYEYTPELGAMLGEFKRVTLEGSNNLLRQKSNTANFNL